jgi:hypothetical protein
MILRANTKKLTLFLTACTFAFSICAQAIPVDPTDLEKAIQARRAKVDEFKAIATEAQKRGLRVYLAGGLAASYGDFIKHQLLAEQGKMEIQPNRLEPVAANITLPEQDLDLVITRADGTPESVDEIQAFKAWLEKGMPREYKNKSLWDVNGLKTAQKTRLAWSGDPDFARQNNDSLSIGLIELTEPPAGTSVIQEADHIVKPAHETSLFLKDLAGDQVHFLRSPEHAQTLRAKEGMNPEILGAIRVLTKAFQFDKAIPKTDLIEVAKIIRDFNPSAVTEGSYVDTWLKTRAKRLITHSYAAEMTNPILDHLGLREKLIQLSGRSGAPDTLSWWMYKVPLSASAPAESKNPLPSVTAGELGITHVDHVTDPEAARLITWRYDGVPRVFMSREHTLGENAVHGSGFYTNIIGQREFGTSADGSVVQLSVDPKAREGIDFRRIGSNGEGVLWLNSARLHVLHPQYNPSGTCKDLAERLAINLAVSSKKPSSPRLNLRNLADGIIGLVPLIGVTASLGSLPYFYYTSHSDGKSYDKFAHGTPEESAAPFDSLLKHADKLSADNLNELAKFASSDNLPKAKRSIEVLGATSKIKGVATQALLHVLANPSPNLNPKEREEIRSAAAKALQGRVYDEGSVHELESAILTLKDPSLIPYFTQIIRTLDPDDSKRVMMILDNVKDLRFQ